MRGQGEKERGVIDDDEKRIGERAEKGKEGRRSKVQGVVERALSGGCVEVIRACRFGFAGGCVKKLKTVSESVVERVVKV